MMEPKPKNWLTVFQQFIGQLTISSKETGVSRLKPPTTGIGTRSLASPLLCDTSSGKLTTSLCAALAVAAPAPLVAAATFGPLPLIEARSEYAYKKYMRFTKN